MTEKAAEAIVEGLRPQSGPFSKAFRGKPSMSGQEVGGGWENAAKGFGQGMQYYGGALMAAGFWGITAAPATAGISAGLGGAAIGVGFLDVVVGGYIVSAATEKERRDEKAEADKAAADKAAADKAAADKAAADKAAAEAEKKRREKEEKDKKPSDPKKKGETGLYDDDPYGDGGGNPAWGRLDQIPVDDSGGGGIGPKWLDALPAEDGGGGIGPKWVDSLPAEDGSGGGTPTSAYATSVLTVAGPGLQSLCVRTSSQTMLILGMPKLADNGGMSDAGVWGALLR